MWGRRPPLRYKVNVILNTSLQNINQLPQQLQENESQLKSDQQLLCFCLINKPMTSYHCICYNNYRSTSLPSQCPTFQLLSTRCHSSSSSLDASLTSSVVGCSVTTGCPDVASVDGTATWFVELVPFWSQHTSQQSQHKQPQ